MTKVIKRFINDERGLETVEYAVMTALVVSALVLAITALTGAVSTRFGVVQGVISTIV